MAKSLDDIEKKIESLQGKIRKITGRVADIERLIACNVDENTMIKYRIPNIQTRGNNGLFNTGRACNGR